jgi:hypothetical protein
MSDTPRIVAMTVLLAFVLVCSARGGDSASGSGVLVLDASSVWRSHQTIAPPVVKAEDGAVVVRAVEQPWLHEASDGPPDGWTQLDFDDSRWPRGPAHMGATEAPLLGRLCLRGRFRVTAPSDVENLRLSVGFNGGAIVYLNGREIARSHLPAGEDAEPGSATMYSEEAYCWEEFQWDDYADGAKVDQLDAIRRRTSNISIAREWLRPGVNVLAIEVLAPLHNPCVAKGIREAGRKRLTPYHVNWSACDLRHIRLTAESGAGIEPNARRPRGLQVWNGDVLANDFTLDFGDRCESLRPVRIVGVRNGTFSGKVLIGSDKAIKDLAVEVTDLRGTATVAASAMQLRYAVPYGSERTDPDARGRYTRGAEPLGLLLEEPPATINVNAPPRPTVYSPDGPDPVAGAVTAVWVTVKIPGDAKAGLYKGTISIQCDSHEPRKVPIELEILDWQLPETQDYRTWVELIQSPDTLVEEYGCKPWSEEHWELIARSMELIAQTGSRVIYIPAISRTNHGNAESMIRWIARDDGGYDWDFSIMDRYLDLAVEHMGKPKVVCFWIWETSMFPTIEDPRTYEQYRPGDRTSREVDATEQEGLRKYIGKGPLVTVVDPKTGKTSNEHLPYLLTPSSRKLWKTMLDELRKRMDRRGLSDVMMLGTTSDIVMRKDQFAFYRDIAGDLPWVSHSHFDVTSVFDKAGLSLGYFTSVMNINLPGEPTTGRFYGWRNERLHAQLRSRWGRDDFPLTVWRHQAEVNVAGGQRGVGRIGGDLWPVMKDRRGRRTSRVSARYPESSWRSNDLCSSLLGPGPKGAVATVRFEMLREGVQESEARIYLECVLTDDTLRERLPEGLAQRCQQTLDDRIRAMLRGMSNMYLDGNRSGMTSNSKFAWWNTTTTRGHLFHLGWDWQQRSRHLYSLAAEVAAALQAEVEPIVAEGQASQALITVERIEQE